jgi:hypothetical protein
MLKLLLNLIKLFTFKILQFTGENGSASQKMEPRQIPGNSVSAEEDEEFFKNLLSPANLFQEDLVPLSEDQFRNLVEFRNGTSENATSAEDVIADELLPEGYICMDK